MAAFIYGFTSRLFLLHAGRLAGVKLKNAGGGKKPGQLKAAGDFLREKP